MIAQALAFGEAGFPIIPVRLSHDGERWRKQPMTTWDQATSNEVTIEWWWRKWPDALPGIPLAKVGFAVVDADKRDGRPWPVGSTFADRHAFRRAAFGLCATAKTNHRKI
jgi:hypothetical protein